MANNQVFVSSSSNVASGATVVVTAPVGILDNDILVCFCLTYKSGGPSIPSCSGFTAWNGAILSTDYRCVMYWKRAASESGSYSWTALGSTGTLAAMCVYRYCARSGDPKDGYSFSTYTTNNTNIHQNGFAPTDSTLAVTAAFAQGTAQTISWSPTTLAHQREYTTLEANSNCCVIMGDGMYAGGAQNIELTTGVATTIKQAGTYTLLAGPGFIKKSLLLDST